MLENASHINIIATALLALTILIKTLRIGIYSYCALRIPYNRRFTMHGLKMKGFGDVRDIARERYPTKLKDHLIVILRLRMHWLDLSNFPPLQAIHIKKA